MHVKSVVGWLRCKERSRLHTDVINAHAVQDNAVPTSPFHLRSLLLSTPFEITDVTLKRSRDRHSEYVNGVNQYGVLNLLRLCCVATAANSSDPVPVCVNFISALTGGTHHLTFTRLLIDSLSACQRLE
jgi:hypothetical protein